jgi:hypothetical protein
MFMVLIKWHLRAETETRSMLKNDHAELRACDAAIMLAALCCSHAFDQLVHLCWIAFVQSHSCASQFLQQNDARDAVAACTFGGMTAAKWHQSSARHLYNAHSWCKHCSRGSLAN